MNTLIFVSLLAVVVLAIVHLLAGSMRFLEGTPRSVWLSMAGGISVAYVFVHLLPDLAEEQQAIRKAVGETFSFPEYHVYLVALIGLAVFYGLERAAKTSRHRRHGADKEDSTGGASSGCTSPPSPSTTPSSATCSSIGSSRVCAA